MKSQPIDINPEDGEENQNWARMAPIIESHFESEAFLASPFGKLFMSNMQNIEGQDRSEKMKVMIKRFKKMYSDKFTFDIERQFYCMRREPKYSDYPNCLMVLNCLLVYGTDFWPTRTILAEANQSNICVQALKVDHSHTKLVFGSHSQVLQWLRCYGLQIQENMEEEFKNFRGWLPLYDYKYQGFKRRRWARFCTNFDEDIVEMGRQTRYCIFQEILIQAEEKLQKKPGVPLMKWASKINPHGRNFNTHKQPYKKKPFRQMSRSRQKIREPKRQLKPKKPEPFKFKKVEEDDLSNLDNLDLNRREQDFQFGDLSKITQQMNRIEIESNANDELNMSIQMPKKLTTLQELPQEGEIANLSIFSNCSDDKKKNRTKNAKFKSQNEDLNLSIFDDSSVQIRQKEPLARTSNKFAQDIALNISREQKGKVNNQKQQHNLQTFFPRKEQALSRKQRRQRRQKQTQKSQRKKSREMRQTQRQRSKQRQKQRQRQRKKKQKERQRQRERERERSKRSKRRQSSKKKKSQKSHSKSKRYSRSISRQFSSSSSSQRPKSKYTRNQINIKHKEKSPQIHKVETVEKPFDYLAYLDYIDRQQQQQAKQKKMTDD